MSLSKRNLGKLNTFIKKHNLVKNDISINNSLESDKSAKVEEPSEIFYSIINNSNNLNDTLEVNQLLKKSEDIFHHINSKQSNYSKNLSIEDQLYDEFNYLLDE